MTKQELFNTIWFYFVQCKAPRASEVSHWGDETCRYRTSDGKKCIIGVLVTDAECAGWSNTPVPQLLGRLPTRLQPHIYFLTQLQDLHDDGPFNTLRQRRAVLRAVAEKWGVNVKAADCLENFVYQALTLDEWGTRSGVINLATKHFPAFTVAEIDSIIRRLRRSKKVRFSKLTRTWKRYDHP